MPGRHLVLVENIIKKQKTNVDRAPLSPPTSNKAIPLGLLKSNATKLEAIKQEESIKSGEGVKVINQKCTSKWCFINRWYSK